MPDHAKDRAGDLSASPVYTDLPAAIEWLCRAFGFTKRLVVPGPDGLPMHCELSLGNAVIMPTSAKPEFGWQSPRALGKSTQSLYLVVDDPDAHFLRAQAEGAEIVYELVDKDYGSRDYAARDLEGHLWTFGTYRPGAYWDAT